ncbi:MAG TPA: LTA synthase family protein [Patescibacteria group bacterium]|nr:LTA synthase family protein [Patescibacteria group bacterium]
MQEIKYSHASIAAKRLNAAAIQPTTLYTFVLLLKLLYFDSQIGNNGLGILYVFSTLGSLLILTSISLILKPKAAMGYMLVLNIILTFIVFCNIMFYRYFKDLLSIPLLTQLGSVGDVGNSLFQLLHYSDMLLAVDFILLPIIGKAIKKRKIHERSRRSVLWMTVILCVIGAIMVRTSFHQLIKSQPTILQTFYDRVYVAQNIGLLNYHAADVYTFVQQSLEESSALDNQKKQEILEFFKAKTHRDSSNRQMYGAGKGKNLIVIQLEAFQQFVIDRSVNGKEITPNLNKLVDSGIYFNNYYYQTAGGGTSDAEFAANVSMFPMKVGAVYIRKPGNYYYSLPMKLKETGYTTIAMHGYKPGFWNRSVVYKNIGFDEFFSKSNLAENELLGMGISDRDFFGQAAEKLKAQHQPFHAFLITLSSHFPYDNDKSKYGSFDVGENKDTLLGDYLEAVHYTDEALGQFVEELENSGILDDTVLVIYGDHHGIPKDNEEELAEFLGKESLSPMEWQQLQKVPMIINGQGIDQMELDIAGGSVDFMPTILNIMGIDASNQPSLGRDLLNSQEGLVTLRNGSFVTNGMVYSSNENICYDIETGKELPISQYSEKKQEAERLLDYSDTIIRFDLADEIRTYLEKERQ